jgi:DNA-binding SARP family transcriptional activator
MTQSSIEMQTPAPAIRIFLFGEVTLEQRRLLEESIEQEAEYECIPHAAWQGRGPALTLLKVLLCQPRRRASKDDVIAFIWSGVQLKNARRACDAAASVLRGILRSHGGESLLLTTRQGSRTLYRLADQRSLWVDADAHDACIDQALHAEGIKQISEALLLWETAYRLGKRGAFLEDDADAIWALERRQQVEGNQRLCVHHLADLYLADNRSEEAESLLRIFWTMHPTDEDVLFRLMTLLEQQNRSLEALRLFAHTEQLLRQEQGTFLSPRITAFAEQLRRQGT